jgi:SAM-dependent methyltransferase
MLDRWERAAPGWGKRAERVRDMGMAVSLWLIDHLDLQPGERLLELAAGPGDTGFLAAELIQPGGTLICSDATDAMLDVARDRAQRLGVDNVEFRRLELEWIDLDTASVDAVLCRWGVMLVPDPEAALREIRRVVRPGGRVALAVWDAADANPWATIPGRALVELGHVDPPDPSAPGMFALAAPGRLQELLEAAGFTEVTVEPVTLDRSYERFDDYLEETLDLSLAFSEPWGDMDGDERGRVVARMTELVEPFRQAEGELVLPGRSLAAVAHA